MKGVVKDESVTRPASTRYCMLARTLATELRYKHIYALLLLLTAVWRLSKAREYRIKSWIQVDHIYDIFQECK